MPPLPLAPSPDLSSYTDGDLRSLLEPYTLRTGPALDFTNWATTFRSRNAAVFRPTEVEHVRWAVELARREGKELRAYGAGHSPSDVACTEGYSLDLKGLNKVLDVDGQTKTFQAEGGILLRNLHPIISEKGDLALSCLGSISDQTLAGAISTSTHGSGVSFGSLSTCVTFLDIVLPLPGAPIVRCSRNEGEDPDLFLSALCGIGAVGIVVGVGMRAERAYKLEEECFSMRFDEFNRRWQEIAESSEHVRCWWFPQVGRVKVSRMWRTQKAVTPLPSALKTYTTEVVLAKHFHAVALTFARVFPSLLPYHAWTMWTFVHQPGPVRCGTFFRGLLEHLWGGRKVAVFPRIEELEAEGKAAQVENSAAPLPLDLSASALSLDKKPSIALPPSDLLTPPLTPPVASPRASSPLSSDEHLDSPPPSAKERLRSPLAAQQPLSSEGLDTLVQAEVGEKREVRRNGNEEREKLPWPTLEEPTYRVGHSVDIFNYDCGFPQNTYESSVPYASTGTALTALHDWHTRALYETGYPLKAHFPIEIRWTEGDDVWLSPTYGGRGCYLGAIQYRPFNLPVPYRTLFTSFSTLLTTRFSGRPHWAKSHHLSPAELRALYPRFDDFLRVRERVDPQGVLVNEYVRRHVLGTAGEGEGKEGMEKSVRRYKARA
ncbi:hypothetical protein JCM6882_000346 [Rhodosporidiobolus microsporus]